MRLILTAVLLGFTWLVAAWGSYVSLLSGLPPVLALLNVLFWTGLVTWAFRVSVKTDALWRRMLPAALLTLSVVAYQYAFRHLKARYLETQGPPRRYYSPYTENQE